MLMIKKLISIKWNYALVLSEVKIFREFFVVFLDQTDVLQYFN